MSLLPDPHGPLISRYHDDPDMGKLVQEFVGELPERMDRLETAWRKRELQLLTRMAHQLKGCCAGYGFPTIGKAAASLEARLRDVGAEDETRLASIASEFNQLIDLCSRACRRV
jgi:HPt (histidine-containing phosphotransfer) domain-containing protein